MVGMSQPPEQVGTDDWRVAMIAMTRQDAANLALWEDWATSAPPTVFGSWAEGFAADPALLRSAPPSEVATLLRFIDYRPAWVAPEVHERIEVGVKDQLADFDFEVVRGSRAHAVDEIRRAQNPTLAALRADLLTSLDAAFAEMDRTGAPVQSALARVLQERGLVTLDAELGEPFERVHAPARDGAASERRLPPQQGWTAPQRGVRR